MEQDLQFNEQDNQVDVNENREQALNEPKEKTGKKIVLLIIAVAVILGIAVFLFLFFYNKDDYNTTTLKDEKIAVLETDKKPDSNKDMLLKDEKIIEVKIDKELDNDQDGLPDYIEKVLGTDINNFDTDGDSYSDFNEIKGGYDPLTDKKLTEEERSILKERIKNEDEEFYKSVFNYKEENNKNDVIVKECGFPGKIGEYSIQDISSGSWGKTVLHNETGFYSVTETLTIYSSTAQVDVLSFISQDSAEYSFNNFTKENFKNCEIDGVKGSCYLRIKDRDEKVLGVGKFFWLESELLKMVFSSSELKKSNGNLEEIVKENLAPFVSQFKNCKVNIIDIDKIIF